MSVPTPEGLASLLVERLHGTYDDGGDWDIRAHADSHIVAVALDHGDGVGEFRAVIVEGDEVPVVAERPYDLDNPENLNGPDAEHRDMHGWYAEAAGRHVEFGGSGVISFAETRRFGAALIALADAHEPPKGPASERIATITPQPGLRPDEVVYSIAYTVDGKPAGGSLALPQELEEWRADLKAGGWTIVDAPEGGEGR